MSTLYSEPWVATEHGAEFTRIRLILNSFLDEPTPVQFNDAALSRRQIMETVVYGGLAHANPDRREEFLRWLRNPFLSACVYSEFVVTVSAVLEAALRVRTLNQAILSEVPNGLV
jgi:hypothetical protein